MYINYLYNDAHLYIIECNMLFDVATVSIPPGMVQDQFGMMGLLTFIRGAETDPGLVSLALGRYIHYVRTYRICGCTYVCSRVQCV